MEWSFGGLCVKSSRKNQLKVQNQISWMVGTDVQSQETTFSQREGRGRRDQTDRDVKGL